MADLANDVAAERGGASPWSAMAVVLTGTIMVVLDATIVNVALAKIGSDLHAGTRVEWIVSAYLLAVATSQPITGWLADRFGRRAVFMCSLAAFTAASAAAAASPNLGCLIGFRVLQGLGGGAMVPVGMAIIIELFPRNRHGRAIAIWGMSAMVAPAVGPTLGGWLVTAASWHWLFLINVPIGAVGIVLGLRLLPNMTPRPYHRLDVVGLAFGAGGLSLCVLGLSQANAWGWSSISTDACLAAGPVLLALFIFHELHTAHPMIEMRMFRERSFSLAMGLLMIVTGAHYGRLVFLPLQLETLRNFTAFKVGLLFAPAAATQAMGMYLGGRFVDAGSARRPIIVGCCVLIAAVLGFGNLTLHTSIAVITVLLALQGIGVGLTNAPLMVAGISDLPPELLGQGTAVRALTNQVAAATAVASLGALVDARTGSHPSAIHAQAAFNDAFLAVAIGAVIAVALASFLPAGRRPGREQLVTAPEPL